MPKITTSTHATQKKNHGSPGVRCVAGQPQKLALQYDCELCERVAEFGGSGRAAEPVLNPLFFNSSKNNIRYALGTSWAGSSRSDSLKVAVRLLPTENDPKWFGVA